MGKYIASIALLAILSYLTPAQADEAAYEQHIARGIFSMWSKDFTTAETEFDSALKESPGDFTATLYLGIAQSRAGDKSAETNLKKALAMKPGDARTSLELGIYYFNNAAYGASRDYLGEAVSAAPNSEISGVANEYLKAISSARGLKPWTVNVSLGTQYDSNVVLSEAGGPLPQGISRKADWRAVGYAKGEYDFLRTERADVSAAYSIYQSLHAKLSDFDVSYHLLEVKATYALTPLLSLRGSGAFEYSFIGGNDYDAAYSLSPAMIISEGGGYSTEVGYTYKKTRFMNSDLFFDNSDRTGPDNLVGITQQLPLHPAVLARIGYFHDVNSTRQPFWSYEGDDLLIGFRFSLPKDIYLDLYGEYYHKNYKGPFEPLSENRRDRTYTASVSATKPLSQRYSVTLGQAYVRNESNTSVFDYNRAITSLFVNARF